MLETQAIRGICAVTRCLLKNSEKVDLVLFDIPTTQWSNQINTDIDDIVEPVHCPTQLFRVVNELTR